MHLFREAVRAGKGENVVFSPAGIISCLQQLKNGTAGKTRAELDALFLGKQATSPQHPALTISQAVFADTDLPLKPAAGKVQRIPLSSDSAAAVDAINKWSDKTTKGCIPALIADASQLSPNSSLLVLNAIHFSATWPYAFSSEDTAMEDFTLSDGRTVKVPTMCSEQEFSVAGGKYWRAAAIPYSKTSASPQLYFVAILPRADAQGFAEHLTDAKLDIIRRKLAEQKVTACVSLPRFSVHDSLRDYSEALRQLGLKEIFTSEADFSPWTDKPDLMLDAIKQKACLDITESGTVAAASTYAEMDEECAEESLDFDRPFLWFIGTLETGTPPLFMGIWEGPVNPSASHK
jgi:serpin B